MKWPALLVPTILLVPGCSRELNAEVNVCFNYPAESGQLALAALQKAFARRGWQYETIYPAPGTTNGFMIKADADGTWIQADNLDPDMISAQVFSFDSDVTVAKNHVVAARDWLRTVTLPTVNQPRSNRPCRADHVPVKGVEWGTVPRVS